MEPERHRIQKQFDQLRSILDKEEQRQLRKLEEEERKGLSVIAEAEGELLQQSQSLRELISDLERRCQGSMTELLQVRAAKDPQPERQDRERLTCPPSRHGIPILVMERTKSSFDPVWFFPIGQPELMDTA